MTTYPVGTPVRLSVAYTSGGTATDPTTVTLRIKTVSPSSGLTLSVAIFGSSTIVKDSTGNYHYDVTPSASGYWYYRWEGTGALVAAAEGAFVAGPSYFF